MEGETDTTKCTIYLLQGPNMHLMPISNELFLGMKNKAGVTAIAFTPDGQHILLGKDTLLHPTSATGVIVLASSFCVYVSVCLALTAEWTDLNFGM